MDKESLLQIANSAVRSDIRTGLYLYDQLINHFPQYYLAFRYRGAWKIEQGKILRSRNYLNQGIADLERAISLCQISEGYNNPDELNICLILARAKYELGKLLQSLNVQM